MKVPLELKYFSRSNESHIYFLGGAFQLLYMSRIANNALLGGGVRVRVWIREQRKIKRRSKVLLSLCWQSWTSLPVRVGC